LSDKQLLDFIAERSGAGEPISVITRIAAAGQTHKVAVTETGDYRSSDLSVELPAEIIAAARKAIGGRKLASIIESHSEADEKVTYVIDVIRPKASLVIFGAGHVGQAVALIAALIGYDVTVVDDREEFLSRARLPDKQIRLTKCDFSDAVRDIKLTRNTAVVIVTRGHQYDEMCLRSVVGSDAGYIGMIGSKRRVLSVFAKLKQDGVAAGDLESVHAPIGLSIGARSPQEIGVAIVAEIISFLNAGTGDGKV
jgi:xanthine dehydrogenase accessory factor